MTLVSKALGWLEALRREDVEAMTPADRRRLADRCRYVAELAEPPKSVAPKGGVLADLAERRRCDE